MLYGVKNNYSEFKTKLVIKYKELKSLENTDTTFLKVNFFLKNGLKKHTNNLISVNLGWYHFFNYKRCYRFVKNYNYLSYELWSREMKKLFFSFYNLNLITKQLRLSRKIRKYTKNKVRYRANTQIIRERSVYGTIGRLWKLIILKNTENSNIRSEFITKLIWDDLYFLYENETPINIQYTMINNIVSRKR